MLRKVTNKILFSILIIITCSSCFGTGNVNRNLSKEMIEKAILDEYSSIVFSKDQILSIRKQGDIDIVEFSSAREGWVNDRFCHRDLYVIGLSVDSGKTNIEYQKKYKQVSFEVCANTLDVQFKFFYGDKVDEEFVRNFYKLYSDLILIAGGGNLDKVEYSKCASGLIDFSKILDIESWVVFRRGPRDFDIDFAYMLSKNQSLRLSVTYTDKNSIEKVLVTCKEVNYSFNGQM